MSVDRFNVPAILIAVVVICAALNVASGVFAPLALALLIIALLWPVQHTLQAFMPRSLALLFSLLSLIIVFVLFSIYDLVGLRPYSSLDHQRCLSISVGL